MSEEGTDAMDPASPNGTAAASGAVPRLGFAVESVDAERDAAAPTLRFTVRIDARGARVRSVMLEVQLRIAATQRRYSGAEQAQLGELFGEPHRWRETVRSLLWTQTTLVVPPFEGETLAQLFVPCTYDFDVASSKYLAGLSDGEIPLELLFSGTVLHTDATGRLQVSRISWDAEAAHRLPVAVWREAIDAHFPQGAWLRLGRESFERLNAYKARRALPTWDAALDALLGAEEDAAP